MKGLKISSLQDIYNNVNEDNIDRFLNDFKEVILNYKMYKQIVNEIQDDGFYWIDDGIHEVTQTDFKSNEGYLSVSIKKITP